MATILRTRIDTALHSIRFRVLLSYLLILTVAFGAVGVSLMQLMSDHLFTRRIHDDQRIVESLSGPLAESLVSLDISGIYALADASAQEGGGCVLVTDRYGVVQADTSSALTGTRPAIAEVESVLGGLESDYGFYDGGQARSTLSFLSNVRDMNGLFAHALVYGGETVGAVVYIASVQEIYRSLASLSIKLIVWLCVVAAIVLIVCAAIMRSVTRPIDDLREGIRRMTGGDLSARVKVRGKNEFSQLASAFNSMSEKIESLDDARSRFVSNASHELKTPLSTIKLLTESLLYQDPIDPDMAREFLGDVNAEIDRLNRIVSDLLTLVNMDSDGTKLKLTDVDLGRLLSEQVKRLSPLARENGIEIDLDLQADMRVSGDPLKLQQVVYNVIDNAIKYTPRGGEVKVRLSKCPQGALIRISDTGIGIPKEDLPHIFDRFYRVDKARSRATGGTGLGLSIVKQIVTRHGGTITAASTPGKGTSFDIVLPVKQGERG